MISLTYNIKAMRTRKILNFNIKSNRTYIERYLKVIATHVKKFYKDE